MLASLLSPVYHSFRRETLAKHMRRGVLSNISLTCRFIAIECRSHWQYWGRLLFFAGKYQTGTFSRRYGGIRKAPSGIDWVCQVVWRGWVVGASVVAGRVVAGSYWAGANSWGCEGDWRPRGWKRVDRANRDPGVGEPNCLDARRSMPWIQHPPRAKTHEIFAGLVSEALPGSIRIGPVASRSVISASRMKSLVVSATRRLPMCSASVSGDVCAESLEGKSLYRAGRRTRIRASE